MLLTPLGLVHTRFSKMINDKSYFTLKKKTFFLVTFLVHTRISRTINDKMVLDSCIIPLNLSRSSRGPGQSSRMIKRTIKNSFEEFRTTEQMQHLVLAPQSTTTNQYYQPQPWPTATSTTATLHPRWMRRCSSTSSLAHIRFGVPFRFRGANCKGAWRRRHHHESLPVRNGRSP